jgi:ABC-2 type transport system permease protein
VTGVWSLFKKDFATVYRSWIGVLVMFSFLLISGIFFTFFLLAYNQISMEAARQSYQGMEGMSITRLVMGTFFLNLGVLFLFLAPLLSMRPLAEEKRFGTLELLYTYPLGDLEIVLGKFLALLGQLVLLLLPTLTYLGVLRILGVRADLGVIGGGLLGYFLLGSCYLAVGLFFSSLTENQILAAGLTFVSLLGLWMLEWVSSFLSRPWGPRLTAFSPFVHFRDFPMGVVDLGDVSYFLCMTSFFLFVTLRVIETRNWRG